MEIGVQPFPRLTLHGQTVCRKKAKVSSPSCAGDILPRHGLLLMEPERSKRHLSWEATRWERLGRAARSSDFEPLWQKAIPSGAPLVGGAGRVNRVVVSHQDTAQWYACAPSGGLWRSVDSGRHWNPLGTQDWAGMGVSDVALHPHDSLNVLAATGDSDFGSAYGVGLMSTPDMGETWQTTGLTFALSESATCSRVHREMGAPDHILVATSDGIWLSEDDGGVICAHPSWHLLRLDTAPKRLCSVACSHATRRAHAV